ncbi:MAG: hypothetical protein RLN79_00850 [Cytophagales bacterium]
MLKKVYSLLALVLVVTAGAFAQSDKAFIYGTVSTIDGDKYKGQIRWGDEEAMWEDEFNSTKRENPYNRWANKDMVKTMNFNKSNDEWEFMGLWKDKNCCDYHWQNHQFVCRFGDIKALEPVGRSEVSLIMKDDSRFNVSGGSNDIGTSILVMDQELGQVKIRWDRVNRIDFESGPSNLKSKIGEPLYGKVKTLRGEFEGFIQWDHEECLSIDKLDGNNNNERFSIEMGNIRKIERYGRGSRVTLKSGREIDLFGTNDVDDSNRGVVARTQDFGKVLVDWRDFEYVEFLDKIPSGSFLSYDDFPKPKRLKGEVITAKGETMKGLIVFDIDETYDYEILEGDDYNVKYSIPFRKIASIKPKNYNYSNITLRNGKEVLLGDSQDVSDRNDGLMIFKSETDEEPVLIPWEGVKEIKFQ